MAIQKTIHIAENDDEVKAGLGFRDVVEHFHSAPIMDETNHTVVDQKYLGTTLIASTVPGVSQYLSQCLDNWKRGHAAVEKLDRDFGQHLERMGVKPIGEFTIE